MIGNVNTILHIVGIRRMKIRVARPDVRNVSRSMFIAVVLAGEGYLAHAAYKFGLQGPSRPSNTVAAEES